MLICYLTSLNPISYSINLFSASFNNNCNLPIYSCKLEFKFFCYSYCLFNEDISVDEDVEDPLKILILVSSSDTCLVKLILKDYF